MFIDLLNRLVVKLFQFKSSYFNSQKKPFSIERKWFNNFKMRCWIKFSM